MRRRPLVAAAGDTVKKCLDQYLARHEAAVALGKRRKSTQTETTRYLMRDLAPLHRLHITKLDRRLVGAELAQLTVENGPIAANRALTALSAFLNWAMREGYCETNIAALCNRNEEASRDRVLDADEIRALWRALPPTDFGDILKLLLLTACRREEIAQLRWSEVDLQKATIRLPGTRTKNKLPHTIPLSKPALAILRGREQNGRAHVFGQWAAGGFSGWSASKNQLKLSLDPWTIHDLRRSAISHMAAKPLSVPPHILEAIANHISGTKAGVAGIYNREAYETEKRDALEAWGAHLMTIVQD